MKKYLLLLLGFVFAFSVVACSDSSEQTDPENPTEGTSCLSQNTESNVEQDESENLGSDITNKDVVEDVLIFYETNSYGGKLSEEYEVLCSGFGNPVILGGPRLPSTYPEKPEGYPEKKTRLSNAEGFNLDKVKEAVYAWIEYAADVSYENYSVTHGVLIHPESWTELEFWEETDGTVALYIRMEVDLPGYNALTLFSGLYEFRVTKRNP